MTVHDLPALRPTHPVAWLAALGCLRILSRTADTGAKLAWSEHSTPHARVDVALSETELTEVLAREWARQSHQGAPLVLDDATARSLPPAERLEALTNPDTGRNDPAKITLSEYRQWAAIANRQDDPTHRAEAVAWLRAIGTDLRAADDRKPPIVSMTAFYLLSRQQKLLQQFRDVYSTDPDFPYAEHIERAFRGWVRVPFGLGMNWDLDGNQNAAESPDGVSRQRVVPGAVWLAMMALPFFPVGGSTGAPLTRSWVEPTGRGRLPHLVVATWDRPLDVHAVEVLLDHPWLSVAFSDEGPGLTVDPQRLRQLGVNGVYICPRVAREVGGQREYFLGKSERLTRMVAPAHGRARTTGVRAK